MNPCPWPAEVDAMIKKAQEALSKVPEGSDPWR